MTEGIRERVVGLVFDDRYLTHNTGLQLDADQRPFPFADPVPHPSGPGQAGRAKHLMDLYGLSDRMVRIAPVLASDEQLTVYHTPEYLDRVAAIAASDASITQSTSGSWPMKSRAMPMRAPLSAPAFRYLV